MSEQKSHNFTEGTKKNIRELPGLKDPERIKKLLGKTAQLNFRLVSDNAQFGIDELISENGKFLMLTNRDEW